MAGEPGSAPSSANPAREPPNVFGNARPVCARPGIAQLAGVAPAAAAGLPGPAAAGVAVGSRQAEAGRGVHTIGTRFVK